MYSTSGTVVPESPRVLLSLLSTCAPMHKKKDAYCVGECVVLLKILAGSQGWNRFNYIDRGQNTITEVLR